MKLVCDMHMHTLASGHAYGTIREMAQAAAERGLEMIGVTEHGPYLPGTCSPLHFLNVAVVPETLYGVRVLHGCEANVLNDGRLDLEDGWMKRLHYLIAGMHTPCFEDQGKEKNTDVLISCMKHEKVFFVSHPDDDRLPIDYERFVEACRLYHVAPELNNSSIFKKDLRLNCMENLRTMLRLCSEMRVPIIVDTDSHDPSQVGDFELALAFMEEMNFDPELVLNTSKEKVLAWIGVKA
ncbi:MAG: phosphatase [Lachnospiraceae bacterium]|nr:phosphatase [Lachnospiraceae bacterium]